MDEEKESIEIYNAMAWAKHWWQWWYTVTYVDTKGYKADYIFDRHGVKAKFLNDFAKPDCDYIIVTAKIPAKQIGEFLESMHELQRLMLISGNLEYEAFCREVQRWFEEGLPND